METEPYLSWSDLEKPPNIKNATWKKTWNGVVSRNGTIYELAKARPGHQDILIYLALPIQARADWDWIHPTWTRLKPQLSGQARTCIMVSLQVEPWSLRCHKWRVKFSLEDKTGLYLIQFHLSHPRELRTNSILQATSVNSEPSIFKRSGQPPTQALLWGRRFIREEEIS